MTALLSPPLKPSTIQSLDTSSRIVNARQANVDVPVPQDTFNKQTIPPNNTNTTREKQQLHKKLFYSLAAIAILGSAVILYRLFGRPIVKIPSYSTASKEFTDQVRQATADMMKQLPRPVRWKLRKAGFNVQVLGKSNEYLNTVGSLKEVVGHYYPKSLKIAKTLPGYSAMSEEELSKEVLKGLKQFAPHLQASYWIGPRGIHIHEDVIKQHNGNIPEFLRRVLPHETGHFLEDTGKNLLSFHPEYLEAIKQDLDRAVAMKIIPIQKTANGYIITAEGKREFANQARQGKPLVEHWAYYVPGDMNSPMSIWPLREAFGEIFAALNGGGAHKDPVFIREKLYPNTAKFIQKQFGIKRPT